MAELCLKSPVPIALDEELIGIADVSDKIRILETIRPQYIVLKPSLLGGFEESEVWIREAERIGAGWWVSSSLESNIGLNAIAQWTSTHKNAMVQGLGTGSLFSNNIPSPLKVYNGELSSKPDLPWDLSAIL
jgi:O-succinylbenzoate synthase